MMRMPNIQETLRLGMPSDIYYYDRASVKLQSIPTLVDNKFVQAILTLGAGSSTFIISVDQGISDICLSVTLPPQGNGVDYTNLAVPQGWLYSLLRNITIRYAGSSSQSFSGAQTLITSLREMPNPSTRDQLMQVGGVAMSGVSQFVGGSLQAFAYLKFPHNSPNGSLEKPNPFPSELLKSSIVVTAVFNPISSIFSLGTAATPQNVPQALASGFFQLKQVKALNRDDLMTSDMDRSKAYSFPTVAFYQEEVQIGIASTGTAPGVPPTKNVDVLLTGFRNGQVRSIILWLTDNADTNVAPGSAGARNEFNFQLPTDVQLRYNGTTYYDAPGFASEFWNLVSTETPSQVQNLIVTNAAAGALELTPAVSKWIEIPFGQVFEQLSGSHMYVNGLQISSAVVNLSLRVPDASRNFTLHAVYAYNAVLLLQGGNCEYAF